MAFWDFLRFGKKRPRPVGQTLERGVDTDHRRRNLALKIGIFGILVLLTVAAFPREDVYDYSVKEGETWNKETLIADFDFSIRKDRDTFLREREAVRRNTPPYFRALPDARRILDANRDTVAAQLDRIFDAYREYRIDASRGRVAEAREDSIEYYALR
ncbi:MAG: metal-dependent phosphohydrolase, partial [Rhodothermales bacterium]|nr:metal-dependent phosphohydrolase [Rhodothermales bacterium]